MTAHDRDETVELVLFNRAGVERIALACAGAYAALAGCPPDRIEDLKTAVAEATANAVMHGNRSNPDARVTVALGLIEGGIEATVTDQGEGLKREVPDPDIVRIIERGEQPSGIGLFLMRRLSDRVSFESHPEGGHSVRITVRWP